MKSATKRHRKADLKRLRLYLDLLDAAKDSGSKDAQGALPFPDRGQQPFWSSSECPRLKEIETQLRKSSKMASEVETYLESQRWYTEDDDSTATIDEAKKSVAATGASDWHNHLLYDPQKPSAIYQDNCTYLPSTCETIEHLKSYILGQTSLFALLPNKETYELHQDFAPYQLNCLVGIVVPPNCGISVAGQERLIYQGDVIFFDPTLPHAVWNKSDRHRIVMVLKVAHPVLTPIEIQILKALMNTEREKRM